MAMSDAAADIHQGHTDLFFFREYRLTKQGFQHDIFYIQTGFMAT